MTNRQTWSAIALTALVAIVFSLEEARVAAQAAKQDDEVITIEGAKNPELIPQWLAWQEAFRIMGMPYQLEVPIPTTIWHVTTASERDFLRKESVQSLEREDEVGAQVVKIREALTPDTLARDQERVKQLEYRRKQAILDTRERVLARLTPEGQAALRAFVEEVKKGTKISIQKSLLAEYSKPE